MGPLKQADGGRFASAILLRPAEIKKGEKKERKPMDKYHQQLEVKKQLKLMLDNEEFIPRVSHSPEWRSSHAGTHPARPLPAHDAGQQPDAREPVVAREHYC